MLIIHYGWSTRILSTADLAITAILFAEKEMKVRRMYSTNLSLWYIVRLSIPHFHFYMQKVRVCRYWLWMTWKSYRIKFVSLCFLIFCIKINIIIIVDKNWFEFEFVSLKYAVQTIDKKIFTHTNLTLSTCNNSINPYKRTQAFVVSVLQVHIENLHSADHV